MAGIQMLSRWLRRALAPKPTVQTTAVSASGESLSGHRLECVGARGGALTNSGLIRDRNEDAFLLDPALTRLAVADGMGGNAAGDVASALVIESIRSALDDRPGEDDPHARLQRAFDAASGAIRAYATQHPDSAGMGATLIVALIERDVMWLAHAGDVRAYLCRSSHLSLLTFDHTAGGKKLREGSIQEDAVRDQESSNRVMRYVGADQAVAPEHSQRPLSDGDILLLCSDGLWNELSHDQIASLLSGPGRACDLAVRLVSRALAAGGRDNVTALVYRHQCEAQPTDSVTGEG